jgi:hypothetical protein
MMPLAYEIDRSRRIVFVRAFGILTPEDFFAYQNEVWSGTELKDYDECVDMSEVTRVIDATGRNMDALATLAVKADDPLHPSKLAIIATNDLHFGLARMYETYRGMQPDNSRLLGIFRSRDEALRWLTGQGKGQ